MKKNNKKWIALLEALLAMTIMIFILWFIAYIISDIKKYWEKNNEILTMMQVERFKNNLVFLKDRLISKGRIISQTENDLFYGWDKLKITNTETLNQLNWTYKIITSNSCDSWVWRCLEKIPDTEFAKIPLGWKTIIYKEDVNWKLITNAWLTEKIKIDCTESWTSCLEYRLIIKDHPWWDYENVTYLNPSWSLVTLNDKKIVTIEIRNNEFEETKKFNYLLSIY